MFKQELSIYKVYDVFEGKHWETPKGKSEWQKPNHAKNAVNANPPEFMWRPDRTGKNSKFHAVKFSEQDRFVIEKADYILQDVSEC